MAELMSMIRFIWASGLGAVLLLAAPAIEAGQDHPATSREASSHWHAAAHSRVRLVRGGLAEDGRDLVALIIELDEGWHTYWRSPGVAGLPPTFNWEGSQNVRGVDIEWPVPQYIAYGDYEAYGYYDRLLLPMLVTRDAPGAPAQINLAVGYAVCEAVCIPALGFLSLRLPEEETASQAELAYRDWIHGALARVPVRDLESAGLTPPPAELARLEDGSHVLRLSLQSETAFDEPYLIVEGPKGVTFGRPALTLSGGSHLLDAIIPVARDEGAAAPIGEAVVVTLIGGVLPAEFTLDAIVAVDGHDSLAAAP